MRALDARGGVAHAFDMNLLFDSFDAVSRTPEIDAAIAQLAGNEGGDRGEFAGKLLAAREANR